MADPVPGPEFRGRAITLAVKLFAGLREQAGWDERQITLPPGPQPPTPRRLWQILQIGQPGTSQETAMAAGQPRPAPGDLALAASALPDGPLPVSVRVAVNQSFAEGDQLLVDGDEVAYLPAISGG